MARSNQGFRSPLCILRYGFASAGCWALLILLLLGSQCQSSLTPTPRPPTAGPPPASPQAVPRLQPGDGSDVLDKLLERGSLRVGIRVWPSAEFSPPAFRGAANAATGGALTGFEVDIARLIAEGLGLELELIEAYPPTILSGDWQGAWDIALASLVPFDQITSPLIYSQPYGFMPMAILTPATTEDIQTIDQLAGRRIGVLRTSAYETILTAEAPLTWQNQPLHPTLPAGIQVVPVSNLALAIDQLSIPASNDLEAIFAPAPILEDALRSGLPVKISISPQAMGTQPLALAIAPQAGLKRDRLQFEINSLLERKRRQGTLAEIYVRWYDQDLSKITSP